MYRLKCVKCPTYRVLCFFFQPILCSVTPKSINVHNLEECFLDPSIQTRFLVETKSLIMSQVCGEAIYTGDIPSPAGCLHAVLVTSTHPHARLVTVDASPALECPGVRGYYAADDVPGGNDIGPVFHDEECFASEKVTCVGQVIGVVVADTVDAAKRAAALVQVLHITYIYISRCYNSG